MLSNLSEEYKEKLKIIKEHFGEDVQAKKLIEEMEEFKHEIEKFHGDNIILRLDGAVDLSKILEELTDCCVVAEQIGKIEFLEFYFNSILVYYFDDIMLFRNLYFKNKDTILEIARQKIDRTLERIESGYYEPVLCPECCGDGFHVEEGNIFVDCEICNGTGKVERKEK